MSDIAARAVAAATHCEVKKDALRQNQTGDWKVTFTVADIPANLITAPMGTRYVMALVQIGDDEEPVTPATETEGVAPVAKERRERRSMKFAQRAGMLINDPVFWQWMTETRNYGPVPDAKTADWLLKCEVEVESKRDLDTNPDAAERYANLESRFLSYKANGEHMRSAAQ